MILKFSSILILVLTVTVLGMPDPLLVESKTQQELDNILSRLIPREQFLVQVTANVEVTTERRLVEGETIINAIPKDPEEEPPPTMPGFVPEPTTRTPQLPQQSRQAFKTVDVPILKMVHVHVNFDDELPLATVTRSRLAVEQYMAKLYAGKNATTFGQMRMLKPEKKRDPAAEQEEFLKKLNEWEKSKEKKVPSIEEQAWKYGRWTALFLLSLVVLTQFLKPGTGRFQHIYAGSKDSGQSAPPPKQAVNTGFKNTNEFLKEFSNKEAVPEFSQRKLLIDRFLLRSEVFRIYYESLDVGVRGSLYAALRGPGYERLLEGLGFDIPQGNLMEPTDLEEFLDIHTKNFEELARAVDWQSQQSFGFLQKLTDAQLFSLATHMPPKGVAMMLRFMKSNQSAHILDSMPTNRRFEILAAVPEVMAAPISEIQKIEKEGRYIVEQMPALFYGEKKEDINFWGKVVSDSTHQDELLDAIEKTNPEIYPNLKKFRFSLEDAASLPNNLLEKVLSETENEELGLALASCRDDVMEVLLDAVPERRRRILLSQIPNYKTAPKSTLTQARGSLTRKMREVLT